MRRLITRLRRKWKKTIENLQALLRDAKVLTPQAGGNLIFSEEQSEMMLLASLTTGANLRLSLFVSGHQ